MSSNALSFLKSEFRRSSTLRAACALASTLLLALPASGCESWAVVGSGHLETREFPLQNAKALHALDVCCGFQVTIEKGQAAHLTITADDNLLPDIVVEERSGSLGVGFPDSVGGYQPSRPVRVELVLADLDHVSASGGSEVRLLDGFEAEELHVELSGGGHLKAQGLQGTQLEVDLSGGGEAELRDLEFRLMLLELSGGAAAEMDGKLGTLEADLSGGSQLDAIECKVDAASLSLSGGGFASVQVSEVLDVSASGGAEVVFRGPPKTLIKELSGGSVVHEE